ncbi:MAG: hypothetical protein K0R50_912 [Eubacterium sp.]|jgi:membrane protein DedA with SNARE-associated domain|nr:hypothetical protein [Eubacterium sp.]
MSTLHKSKKRIISIIEFVIAICIFVVLSLYRKVDYWAPEKGEFGTRRISYIDILKENPKELTKYILVFIIVAMFGLIIIFFKKRLAKDWLK